MSHPSRRARTRTAAAAGLALIAAAGVAAPAQATVTRQSITYTCSFPTTGDLPVTIDYVANIPSTLERYFSTDPAIIRTTVHTAGLTPLRDVLGIASFEGDVTGSVAFAQTGVQGVLTPYRAIVPKTSFSGNDPLLQGRASFAAPSYSNFPQGTVTVSYAKNVALNIVPRKADGSGYTYAELGDNGLHPAIAGPAGYSVLCTPAPTSQNLAIGTTSAGYGDLPVVPTAPDPVTFSDITPTSATISWGTSRPQGPGGPVTSYTVVADDGTVVATTDASTHSAKLTGLDPSSIYGYSVHANERSFNAWSGSLTTGTVPVPPKDTIPPSAPSAPTVTFPAENQTPTSASAHLYWNPSTDDTAVTGYRITAGKVTLGAPAATAPIVVDSTVDYGDVPGLEPGSTYDFTVVAVDAAGNTSTVSPTTRATAPVAGVDTTPPTAPGKPTVNFTTTTSGVGTTISWAASTDDVGVTSYRVTLGAVSSSGLPAATPPITVQTSGTTVPLPAGALQGNTSYDVTVTARDAAGNVSDPSPTTRVTTPTVVSGDQVPPSTPGVPTASFISDSPTALLSWTPSTDNVGVARYLIDAVKLVDGVPTGTPISITSTTANAPLNGLEIGVPYRVSITAQDAAGNVSQPSQAVITVPNQTGGPTTSYTVAGSATLKNLAKGSLPLSGSLNNVGTSGNAFTGDLALGQSTANLKALGFLPVTATVAFVPTERLTGTVTGTSISATAKVRIKLPSLKVLGVQIAGGANCQATQIATIPLASTGTFDAARGGTLAGSFAISNLSGCGALNGLV
ncbi:MAG: fibronectin type III domain-containing protein, partial [Solirubrobacteraceae bacterium]